METVNIQSIIHDRSQRIEYLIREGRYEDAIAICEEFGEWIGQLMT
jgi:hypothetical protein